MDAAGNVYVTGRSDFDGTGQDYATVKYNAGGEVQWVVRYNGLINGDDGAYDDDHGKRQQQQEHRDGQRHIIWTRLQLHGRSGVPAYFGSIWGIMSQWSS